MVFRFGPFAVDGDLFELTKDGSAVPVEPQVLSLILFLIARRDHVVTRDELVEAIWHGRSISDAAIASRIKSARHALDDNGTTQAVIRTVHGRGFRFVAPVVEEVAPVAGPPLAEVEATPRHIGPEPVESPAPRRLDRRAVIAGGVLGATALAVTGALLRRDQPVQTVPEPVANLVFRAREAMGQNTRAGQFQAIGNFRRVVELLPDYADGWGMLGMAYGIPSHFTERAQGIDLRRRGEAAASRAHELDRGNGYGEIAFGILTPFVGHYWTRREHLRRAVEALPGNTDALTYQAAALQIDGYAKESVPLYQQITERPMTPALYNNFIRALWCAGHVEEADRALADAVALYPAQATLWFTRLNLLQFSGRTSEAMALIEDRSGWPAAFGEDYAPVLVAQTRALATRQPALVDAVVQQQLKDARNQAFEAEGAIRMLAALGRVDEIFDIAQAYFFGRGFVIPDFAQPGSAFSPEQRDIRWLFEPVTAPMRSDRRFEPLVRELGLDAYWKKAGLQPDYRRLA